MIKKRIAALNTFILYDGRAVYQSTDECTVMDTAEKVKGLQREAKSYLEDDYIWFGYKERKGVSKNETLLGTSQQVLDILQ